MCQSSVIGLYLLILAPLSLGSQCDSIGGKWYNQLGSELILESGDALGSLQGELRTAVEKEVGAAGDEHAPVQGICARSDSGILLGFSAVFNEGTSAASWIGQCVKCGGEELLQSSWLLREAVDSCSDLWKSTLVNEDLFIRHDNLRRGPRKDRNTHVPQRAAMPKISISRESSSPNLLIGKWYTADGIELDLSVDDINGTIEGTYRKRDAKPMQVTGTFSPNHPGGAFGLQGIWEGSKIAHVWVGQVHNCASGQVLESSWLRRSSVGSCDRQFEATNFGRMSFVRTPPSENNDGGNNWQFSSVFSDMASKISNFFTNLFS